MSEWILFLPIVFLPVSAFIFAFFASRLSSELRAVFPTLLLGLEIVAVLLNIAPINHRVAFSEWPLASFALVFEMDGVGLLLMLAILVVLFSVRLSWHKPEPFDPLDSLILTSAFLFITAGNMPTIYFTWVLLDAASFLRRFVRDIERANALRALALSQLAGLLLFAGTLFINTPYAELGTTLVALALWARLGLYPFHWTLSQRGSDSRDLWITLGIPMLAAASPWIRWGTLLGNPPLLALQWLSPLAGVAIIVSLLWSWHAEQPPRAAAIGAYHAAALIPLAALYGGNGASATALWLTLGTAFGIGLIEIALRWRAESRNHWARMVWFGAVLSITGLPLTPSFLGRAGLYMSLMENGGWSLVLIASVAAVFILAPLWEFGISLTSPEPREPAASEAIGLGVIALAFAALSLGPTLIAQSLGPATAESANAALNHVFLADNLLGLSISLVALIVPVIVSFALRGAVGQFRQNPNRWLAKLAYASDLEWLANLVGGVGYQMSRIARSLAGIVEQNPTVWILLMALWIAIFVLLPR